MKSLLYFLLVALMLPACNKAKSTAKEAINKSEELVGKGTTEFFEGVSEGVDEASSRQISVSQSLLDAGVAVGNHKIASDSLGNNNVLVLYLIFSKAFQGSIRATVYHKNGTEIGRCLLPVQAQENHADYYEFIFSKHTFIELKSRIELLLVS